MCLSFHFSRRTSVVAALLVFLSGTLFAAKVLNNTEKRNRERRAEKFVKEAADLKKQADKLTEKGDAVGGGALARYAEAVAKYGEAEKADKAETQRKLESEAHLLARNAAAACARLGVKCAFNWNWKDRKNVAIYQSALMVRQIAQEHKDADMVAFLDQYSLYVHRMLVGRPGGADAEEKKKLDAEDRKMRQQIAAQREKFNRYKAELARKSPADKNKLLRDAAAAAPQPPEPVKAEPEAKDKAAESKDKAADQEKDPDQTNEDKPADKGGKNDKKVEKKSK